MADDFALRDMHSHANLVAWVSMAVIAFAYRLYPALERSRPAKAQFWLHNLGLPAMPAGLYGIGYFTPGHIRRIGPSRLGLMFQQNYQGAADAVSHYL